MALGQPHTAGVVRCRQAVAEWPERELQRHVTERMTEPTRVPRHRGRHGEDTRVAVDLARPVLTVGCGISRQPQPISRNGSKHGKGRRNMAKTKPEIRPKF